MSSQDMTPTGPKTIQLRLYEAAAGTAGPTEARRPSANFLAHHLHTLLLDSAVPVRRSKMTATSLVDFMMHDAFRNVFRYISTCPDAYSWASWLLWKNVSAVPFSSSI